MIPNLQFHQLFLMLTMIQCTFYSNLYKTIYKRYPTIGTEMKQQTQKLKIMIDRTQNGKVKNETIWKYVLCISFSNKKKLTRFLNDRVVS